MEICQGTPDLVQIGQNYRLLFVKTYIVAVSTISS